MQEIVKYQPKNKIRIVTAASLFDGHDAAINVMRRIIQGTGCEVIHLGHNRSVDEVVNCAIQEDAQSIAMTSYQGGHIEYFKYMFDLLIEKGAGHIKIFAGGGGVILPSEIKELEAYGIAKIYSPDDGRVMGLQGMINDLVAQSDFETITSLKDHFEILVNGLNHVAEQYQFPIIFSTHPRTKKRIQQSGVQFHPLIKNIEPLGFFDYVKLQQDAYIVLSDSGTISEESAMMGFPAVSIRTSTERPEAIDAGSIVLGGITRDQILQSIEIVKKTENVGQEREIPWEYQVKNTSDRVIRVIQSYTAIVNKVIWNK